MACSSHLLCLKVSHTINVLDIQGKLRFGSKTGADNKQSNPAEKFVAQSKVPYVEFCQKWVDQGYTPIFEFISLEKKIVVEYKETTMVLIAIRHNETGRYMLYEEMKQIAEEVGVPVVAAHREATNSIKELLDKISQQKDVEGGILCHLKMTDISSGNAI
jgi:hypothetical protein